eukprot:3698564-Prymnesium_polylepis.1
MIGAAGVQGARWRACVASPPHGSRERRALRRGERSQRTIVQNSGYSLEGESSSSCSVHVLPQFGSPSGHGAHPE